MKLFDKIKSSPFSSHKKQTEPPPQASPEESQPIEKSPTEEAPQPPEPEPEAPLQLGTYNFRTNDNDGSEYIYPTLYQEASDMVKLSILIYTLIELRDLARSGKLDSNSKSLQILDLPLPMDKALSIIASEAETLKKYLDDGAHEEALSALKALAGAQVVVENEDEKDGKAQDQDSCGLLEAFNICWPAAESDETKDADNKEGDFTISTLTAVGDEKASDELVYVVGINPNEKRVTVAFRGSTTKNDFLTDAKIDMVAVPDPQSYATANKNDKEKNEGDNGICIHKGFYEYLFSSGKDGQSKYEEIMTQVQKVFDLKEEYRKECKLYVTGHSLGGALATLFGFYASASSLVPGPVSVISVASPRVGNKQFAACFTEYESQGKLRHLRIANHMDPVTLGPTVSSKRMLTMGAMAFSPLGYLALKLSGNTTGAEESYYHTGIRLKLREEVKEDEKMAELRYSGAVFLPKDETEVEGAEDAVGKKPASSSMKKMSTSEFPLVSHHYGQAYTKRMALVEEDLAGLTLNKVYKTKTGNDD